MKTTLDLQCPTRAADLCIKLVFIFCFFFFPIACVQATQYTWTGTTDTAWTTASNWSPNGVPGSNDTVTVVTGSRQCHLTQNTTVKRLTMSSGTLQMHAYTLSITSRATFTAGTISGTAAYGLICTGSRTSFNGTTMNTEVAVTGGQIEVAGSTFNHAVKLEQTGSVSSSGNGGSTFNAPAIIINNSSGGVNFQLANVSGNTFNAAVKFYNYNTGTLSASNKKSFFNDSIEVNVTNGSLNFGASSGDTAFLAAGKTIAAGDTGIKGGTLLLRRFVQQGSTAQSLTGTGSGTINIYDCVFNGSLTVDATVPLLRDSKFYGAVALTKNGSTAAISDGGNTFYGAFSATATSTGQIALANTTRNIFYGNASFTTQSTGVLRPFHADTSEVHGDLWLSGSKTEFFEGRGLVKMAGASSQRIGGDMNVKFKNLIIKKTGGEVTLDTTASVTDTLKLISGNMVTTASHLLTLPAGSRAEGASNSSFVSGPVKKVGNTAFTFPTGKGSSYRAVEISAPSNSTDAFTGEYMVEEEGATLSEKDTTLGKVFYNRYWNLTRTSGASQVYVKISWDSSYNLSDTIITVASWENNKWKSKGKGSYTGNKYTGTLQTPGAVSVYNSFTLAYRNVNYYYQPNGQPIPCTGVANITGLNSCLNTTGCGGTVQITQDIDLTGITSTNGAILTLPSGATLAGNFDLSNNATGGTMIFSNDLHPLFNTNSMNDMFLIQMEPGNQCPNNTATTIRNLRIRGPQHCFQDLNAGYNPSSSNYKLLNGGIFIHHVSTNSTNYEINKCEIFGFSFAGIYSENYTDEIHIANCYIHHVNSQQSGGYAISTKGGPDITSNCTFEKNVFNDNKVALDGTNANATSPLNWIIQHNTFENGINRHNNNQAATAYLHPPACFFYTEVGGSKVCINTASNFNIISKSPGDVYINNNIIAKKISLPYPGFTDQNVNHNFNCHITNNTFYADRDPINQTCSILSTESPNHGYLKIADNYIENCTWDWDRTQGFFNSDITTTNYFGYREGRSTGGLSPQPPEVNATFKSGGNPLPSVLSNPEIKVVDANAGIEIATSPGSLGSQSLVYIIRPNPSNKSSIDANSSGDNLYYDEQIITSGAWNVLTNFNGYTQPGLYGMDIMAIDNDGSPPNYYGSTWKHYPIVVKPTVERALIFNIKDSYQEFHHATTGLGTTGIRKQVELNGHLIWCEDISEGGDGWERVEIDLDASITLCNTATITPLSFLNMNGEPNVLSFSIGIDPNNTTDVRLINGLFVWVDDVYLKAFNSPFFDNVIVDGDIEQSDPHIYGTNPSALCPWYYNLHGFNFNPCLGCIPAGREGANNDEDESEWIPDICNFTGLSGKSEINEVERKSGRQALQLQLPILIYNTSPVCTTFLAPNNLSNAVVSASTNIDFTELLGCDDYTVNLTTVYPCTAATCTLQYNPNGNSTYYLYQDLTLTKDLTLEGITVAVKNPALPQTDPVRIIVPSGKTLTITWGGSSPDFIPSRLFACGNMWGGIVVEDGGTLVIQGGSGQVAKRNKIEDALTAVHATGNGANVRISYSDFDNNFNSVMLNNGNFNSGSSQSYIIGNLFSCSGGALTREPYRGILPGYQVILTNTGCTSTSCNVTLIGGNSNGQGNVFDNVLGGILVTEGRVNILNNTFTNIRQGYDPMGLRPAGLTKNTAAIYISNKLTNKEVKIGGTGTNEKNDFSNVQTGIIAVTKSSFTIAANTFANTNYTGGTGTPFYNTAITIQNPVAAAGAVKVYNNEITDFRIGIHAENVPGIKIGDDGANKISFNLGDGSSVTGYHAGVWLQSCNDAHVVGEGDSGDPDIKNDAAASGTNLLRGIDIENSTNTRINCNVIKNLPRSITFTGACNGSLMRRNYLDAYEIGVDNYSSVTGDQGFFNGTAWETLDNEWHNGGSNYRVGGVISQGFDWYYRNTSPEFEPSPNQGGFNPNISNNGSPQCDDYFRQQRDVLYGASVGDTLSFEAYSSEYAYLSKKYTFEDMKKDTSMLTEGRITDTDFHSYFTDKDTTNIGKFALVSEWAADTARIGDALALNESIVPENSIEENLQVVNSIYLSTVASGIDLSSADSATLGAIANMNWVEAGMSIYTAAAMLGFEIHPVLESGLRVAHQPAPVTEKQNSEQQTIKVFPNPANDKLYITGLSGSAELEVRNALGNLVTNRRVTDTSYILNISEYSEGIYMVLIKSSPDKIFNKRFAVIK